MTAVGEQGAQAAQGAAALDAGMWLHIDWSQPWLRSLAAVGAPAAHAIATGAPVHAALNRHLPAALQALGLSFVPQADLPEGVAYETHIFTQRRVPTRENLHDFFNGLIWLHWPQLKLHMNRLQAAEIARAGVHGARGRLRDALTVLDENGAVWWAPQALIDALRAKDWRTLMVHQRALWQCACLVPVGHALLEKLVSPRKPITAHVVCLPASLRPAGVPGSCEAADAQLAQLAALQPEVLATKPFAPLPVLGVPGWWAENANFSFYDDSLVFRSQRPRTTHITPGPEKVTSA